MTRELIQAIYDNGLLWNLLRGVSDGLSDSLDQPTRTQMTAYLQGIVRCITVDAESLL